MARVPGSFRSSEVRRPGTYVMRHEKLIFTVTLRMLPPHSLRRTAQYCQMVRPRAL